MGTEFEYKAELQLNDGSTVLVDLEERGWAEPERLANTRVFSLVPKDLTNAWPVVRIHIPEGAKPIFKSRPHFVLLGNQPMGTPLFRSYAVGYFKDNESYWTWVFPNGMIEANTDDPTFADLIIRAMNQQMIKQVPEDSAVLTEATDGGTDDQSPTGA